MSRPSSSQAARASDSTRPLLARLTPAQVLRHKRRPVDAETLAAASVIVEDVRSRGMQAVREHALRLGDFAPDSTSGTGDAPLIFERSALRLALDRIPREARRVLEQGADRVREFALAQRACLKELSRTSFGASTGHTVAPVDRAGCYAPGGRFPLPSSVLMTAVTARAAGVSTVWVASPRPTDITRASAALADADALLAVGGAQAIAALAFGADPVPACDAIVGPGNRWVTAAKKLVAGEVAIDMLAGPSEVLILADDSADPAIIAADLLAQAEHDTDAVPWLVTTDAALIDRVEDELTPQLASLPTAAVARVALGNGAAILCADLAEAIATSDRLAPEHLEVMTRDAADVARRCRHFGAVFIGQGAAEVIGDYAIGPNHTLPTGGASRFAGGLSVFNFLRIRTFIETPGRLDADVYHDTAAFARLEGLEAHARAAERRATP